MTVGERIRKLRKEKGLTQEELGNLLGVKKAAVQKYESGLVQNLKQATIQRLCEIFNREPNYFILTDRELEVSLREEVVFIERIERKYGKEVVSIIEIFIDLDDEGKEKVLKYAGDIATVQVLRKEISRLEC